MIALGGVELCRMLSAIPQEPNDLRLGRIFKGDVQRHVGGRDYFHSLSDSMEPIIYAAWSFRGATEGGEPGIHGPLYWSTEYDSGSAVHLIGERCAANVGDRIFRASGVGQVTTS